jgi:GT2 family glycosyltransferase
VTCPASGLLAERLPDIGMANPVVASLPEPSDADCTFVVPVPDRHRELDRLLTRIGTGQPVIVVDDASQRPEAVEAAAVKHGAGFVPLATNVGPAGARNAGLRLVTTSYVVFVDSDVVLAPDTVPTLLRHFTDPKVAMAVPRVAALPAGRLHELAGPLRERPLLARPGRPPRRRTPWPPSPGHRRPASWPGRTPCKTGSTRG